MEILFATNNQHKADELRAVLPAGLRILTLKEAGLAVDVPEPYDTLEENAQHKATTVYHLTNTACFSEDTGLEVDALDGQPGVHSARYAGNQKSVEANTEKLLLQLKDKESRTAQFRTVICLIVEGSIAFFEGVCKGRIIEQKRGTQGFGYDPVFVPDGAQKTFAEMDIAEKNVYSHRQKAAEKLVAFLKNNFGRQQA